MTKRIQGREVRWAKHDLQFWEDRALTSSLPNPLRIAAFAYANISANGHVETSGENLQAVLVDTKTGAVPTRETTSRAVSKAVKFGLLAEGSSVSCLVVPYGVRVDVGTPGAKYAKCRTCH